MNRLFYVETFTILKTQKNWVLGLDLGIYSIPKPKTQVNLGSGHCLYSFIFVYFFRKKSIFTCSIPYLVQKVYANVPRGQNRNQKSFFIFINEIRSLKCTLSNTLSIVHLRLEDFSKNDIKVAVLFYPTKLTIVNLRICN